MKMPQPTGAWNNPVPYNPRYYQKVPYYMRQAGTLGTRVAKHWGNYYADGRVLPLAAYGLYNYFKGTSQTKSKSNQYKRVQRGYKYTGTVVRNGGRYTRYKKRFARL